MLGVSVASPPDPGIYFMSELLRAIVARMRAYVGSRHAPRQRLRLPCRVSLLELTARGENSPRTSPLDGYTRDLSTSGLALILPAVRVGGRYLTGPDVTLSILLEHPAGPLALLATPVRYEQLGSDDAEQGYLIGVHLKEMSAADRARYEAYLAQSRQPARPAGA